MHNGYFFLHSSSEHQLYHGVGKENFCSPLMSTIDFLVADNVCYWFFRFILFSCSHLVNLTFVLLTDPSFILQLQFICCTSTSFNSLFFLSLTIFFSLFFFFIPFPPHTLSRFHRGHISTMFLVLAEHLASKPIHSASQYVCSYNVGTQSTLVIACLTCQIQITGYW